MNDGPRGNDNRYRERVPAEIIWQRLLNSLSMEGIISFLITLTIILALINYVIIPQLHEFGENVAPADRLASNAIPPASSPSQ